MSYTSEVNLGLNYGWGAGESGWGGPMNDNLKRLGALVQLAVKERLSVPPAWQDNGDRYIIAAGATGDWSGHDQEITVWDPDDSAWRFYAAVAGWRAYVVAEKTEYTFNGNRWEVPIDRHLAVLDRDLAAPPATPGDGDRYIVAAGATDAWSGHGDDIAVWDETASAWTFHTPTVGWLCYIADEAKLSAYTAAGWSAGLSI